MIIKYLLFILLTLPIFENFVYSQAKNDPYLNNDATLLKAKDDIGSLFNHLLNKSEDFSLENFLANRDRWEGIIETHLSGQMALIEEVSKESNPLLTDEFLRGQLWNLWETLKLIDKLYPELPENLAILQNKAQGILISELSKYQELKKNVDLRIKQKKNSNHEETGLLTLTENKN